MSNGGSGSQEAACSSVDDEIITDLELHPDCAPRLSVCLSVSLPACLSVRLYACLSVCMPVFPTVYLLVCPTVCLSVRSSIRLSAFLPACLCAWPDCMCDLAVRTHHRDTVIEAALR